MADGSLDRRGFLLGAGAAALAVVGCSGSADPDSAAPTSTTTSTPPSSTGTPNVAGRRDHRIEVEGLQRDFIVYTPELAAGDVAAPVVVMLHGSGGNGERFLDISGWRELADVEGLIAVFPSAVPHCFHEQGRIQVGTKWNAGQFDEMLPLCTPEEVAALAPRRRALADHPLVDDVVFTDQMLDVVAAEHTIDASRVFGTGFSNGGQLTCRLAVERSERFAALACAAGNLSVTPTPAPRPVPLVYSVGSIDDRFTVTTGGQPLPVDETIFDIPFFRGLLTELLTVTQLEDRFETATLGPVTSFVFSNSLVGADNELQFAIVDGLAHQYPNGAPASLWEFFQRYTL